ncbi:MAG: YdcF family protein [Gammaproteobacteria bacterium]
MAAEAPRDGYAAILLLGGVGTPPPEGSNQHIELSNAAGRVWLAARLYHAGLAPRIIVSGGGHAAADGKALVPEAESIRPLLQDLGVPSDVILIEPRSLNTHENAQESKRLIGDLEKVALVTSALHVPRAMREMQVAGITAHAFPTNLRKAPGRRAPFQRWLPNPDALALSTLAIKEWLGIFKVWMTGIIASG